jgi:4-hydroxysphinganine ceramide fatty acyl 2-hydroxylase
VIRRFTSRPGVLLAAGALGVAASFTVWRPASAFGALGGVGCFALLEYLGHRVLYHRWFPRAHARHHADPGNLDHVFLPVGAVAGAVAAIAAVAAVLPRVEAPPFADGALVALLWYEWMHFLAHVPDVPKTAFGVALKRYHLLHHHLDEHLWFGITNPLGDMLFGTYRRARDVEARTGIRFLYP